MRFCKKNPERAACASLVEREEKGFEVAPKRWKRKTIVCKVSRKWVPVWRAGVCKWTSSVRSKFHTWEVEMTVNTINNTIKQLVKAVVYTDTQLLYVTSSSLYYFRQDTEVRDRQSTETASCWCDSRLHCCVRCSTGAVLRCFNCWPRVYNVSQGWQLSCRCTSYYQGNERHCVKTLG